MNQPPIILIIEDNQMNMDMARFLLHKSGYTVLESEEAVTGISLAQTHQPDLVLMDMHLPYFSGYEACHLLKADPKTTHIPIIAFTALAMEDELQKAEASGCNGIISKPINVDHFAQQIADFLRQSPSPVSEAC